LEFSDYLTGKGLLLTRIGYAASFNSHLAIASDFSALDCQCSIPRIEQSVACKAIVNSIANACGEIELQ